MERMPAKLEAFARADRGFVLRTPLLPHELFHAWARAEDPRRLLAELIEQPEIREALFVASPALSEGVARWRRDPDSAVGEQVELALARYVSRMAGRSTPFGLFSAVSAGRLAHGGELRLAPRADYRRRTRIDNDYLFALVGSLARQPEVRAKLRYRINSSLYEHAGRLRYAEARLHGKDRSYHLVGIEPTPYLAATLARCAPSATLAELAAGLAADDPEITLDEAGAYVEELATAQVLVPELGITVTGPEPIDGLIAQLAAAGVSGAREVLERARDEIAAIDRAGLGNDPERYVAVAGTLSALPEPAELARLFQVDMVKPADATLDPAIAADVARAIQWVRSVQRVPVETPLQRFRDAFWERYEARTVPLVEALDQEAGIGFDVARVPAAQGAPLLAGLRFPVRRDGDERAPWSSFERHMARRLAAALAAGDDEIVLTEDDRAAMLHPQPAELPDAFHATVRLARGAGGELSILLGAAMGPSGARMAGRFCHASPEIEAIVRAHLAAEEATHPGAVFAEIVHLHAGRLGNIACRPVLRGHEIVYLGVSGAPEDCQLPITDLMVSVRDARVVLTSRRLGREIVPRLTNAHAFRNMTLPIYRFLCELGDVHGVEWSWGVLEASPYLPRVRLGRVVLARASWMLGSADLEPITRLVRERAGKAGGPSPAARRARLAEAIAALRVKRKLPRFIAVVEADHELAIDLDNPMLVQVFADELAGKRWASLVELFPEPGTSPVIGPEGSYANEVVLGFVRTSPVAPAARALAPAPAPRVTRSFAPGSSWLYARLYTGTGTTDRVLVQAIAPLVREVLARGDATHWFFLRYEEHGHHLRVRFAGDPARLAGHVLPALHAAIAPLREDGSIWKVQLDTYEREIERYGGDSGIELCEQLFWIDSEAALQLLELIDGEELEQVRWRLALRGSEGLLAALGVEPDVRAQVFARARDVFGAEHQVGPPFYAAIGERYKRERGELEALFARDPARDAAHPLAPALAVLDGRDARLAPIARELAARDAAGALAPPLREMASSLVHMHINRLLNTAHRAQELVIYDLLRRLHEARRAAARRGT